MPSKTNKRYKNCKKRKKGDNVTTRTKKTLQEGNKKAMPESSKASKNSKLFYNFRKKGQKQRIKTIKTKRIKGSVGYKKKTSGGPDVLLKGGYIAEPL